MSNSLRFNASRAQRLAVAGLITLSTAAAVAMGSRPKADDEAIATRIQPVARVEMAAAAGAAKGSRGGEEIVNGVCSACHAAGVAGAPKIGDKAAWGPRLTQGLDGLLKSATAGKNAMPPKGGADVTPAELTRAIVYMTNKSGASFKEPVEKK
ncbi:MAG: c-type cytochrome [Sterolibacterium sp.]|jgi:cytochrome c5